MRLATLVLIGGMGVLGFTGGAQAIDIVIDYTYDTGNFFGSGNPDGAAAGLMAKDSLEAAADYFSEILTDSFGAISTPDVYQSQYFNGQVVWQWQANFSNPSTGSTVTLTDPTIAEDQYIIYAGARSIGGSTLGIGGPGGWGYSSNPSGGFTQEEINEINDISDAFFSSVEDRGEATGFANWGGAITFDNDSSTDWWYDRSASPTFGTNDFYSVAVHELAHALGFGASDDWDDLVSGSTFYGSASLAENGSYPALSSDRAHWAENTMSTVFGGSDSQEAAMDPNITQGTRKLFTALDAAGLEDIGWTVVEPIVQLDGDLNNDGFVGLDDLDIVLGAWNQTVPPANSAADPSGDGFVGLDDLDIVLNNWNAGTPPTVVVPEPATIGLFSVALMAVMRRR